ncbi:MAG: tetratricopeptide repeat protein [Chloroflexi bacterium]|nr:tetratricopeptide repeat protein [Chloroflexota bacterium]
MTEALVLVAALIGGGFLALRPLLGRVPWPEERPDERDDVARAVSSLRDLEFARAAGTIDAADEVRLRRRIEASAFATSDQPAPRAPVRTFIVAALLAGTATVLVVALLPASAGDRAPGETITGTVPGAGPSTAALEARIRETPSDIPTRLALADRYEDEGRAADAAEQYRAVLTLDAENVPALNGLGILLFRSGSMDGALLAADRVLAIRPRDADALFLKGLVLYTQGKHAEAVTVWTVYLEVGEFHPAAAMVRNLYADATRKSGR